MTKTTTNRNILNLILVLTASFFVAYGITTSQFSTFSNLFRNSLQASLPPSAIYILVFPIWAILGLLGYIGLRVFERWRKSSTVVTQERLPSEYANICENCRKGFNDPIKILDLSNENRYDACPHCKQPVGPEQTAYFRLKEIGHEWAKLLYRVCTGETPEETYNLQADKMVNEIKALSETKIRTDIKEKLNTPTKRRVDRSRRNRVIVTAILLIGGLLYFALPIITQPAGPTFQVRAFTPTSEIVIDMIARGVEGYDLITTGPTQYRGKSSQVFVEAPMSLRGNYTFTYWEKNDISHTRVVQPVLIVTDDSIWGAIYSPPKVNQTNLTNQTDVTPTNQTSIIETNQTSIQPSANNTVSTTQVNRTETITTQTLTVTGQNPPVEKIPFNIETGAVILGVAIILLLGIRWYRRPVAVPLKQPEVKEDRTVRAPAVSQRIKEEKIAPEQNDEPEPIQPQPRKQLKVKEPVQVVESKPEPQKFHRTKEICPNCNAELVFFSKEDGNIAKAISGVTILSEKEIQCNGCQSILNYD